MENPILDSMDSDLEFESETSEARGFDPEYGKGIHPKATITSAESQAAGKFGRSIILKVNLKGDSMPFTFFVDTPTLPHKNGDEGVYETEMKRYSVKLNRLKTLVHATGYWVSKTPDGKLKKDWPKAFVDFSTDEAYEGILNRFRQLEGSTIGLNVKYYKAANGKLYKDVWGLEPKL